MVLDKSTTSLQLKLGAAGAIPVTVDYYDVTPQTKTDTQPLKGASYLSTTDGTNYVTICPAPAQGTVRVITYICVHDNDAGSETFTLSKVDVSTAYIQVVITLATTESAVWTPESGWNIEPLYDSSDVDINGGTIDGTAIGGTTPAAGAFTTLSASGTVSQQMTSQTNPVRIGQNSDSVTFGHISFNGVYTTAGMQGIFGGGGSTALFLNAPTGNTIAHRINNSDVTVVSSSGLTVTGTISATQRINANASDYQIGIYDGVGEPWYLRQAGDTLAVHRNATGDIGVFTATGLAVTGAISASSPITAGIDGSSVAYYLPGNGAIRSVGGGIMYIDSAPTVGGDIHIRPAAIPVGVFSSTGLAVTGAISSTGNLTVTGGTITTGSTTALSLATSGGTVASLINIASAVNYLEVRGAATGGAPGIASRGSDTNANFSYDTQAAGSHIFTTGTLSATQMIVSHTASANRYITLTGSNGGNPTIGTSAGSLAITPSIEAGNLINAQGAIYASNGAVGISAGLLAKGDATHTGYVGFQDVNGVRQGYIGYSTSTGATDTGTLNYIGAIHSFTGAIEGTEQTAPAAPAANGYRIFAQDNGAGKTQLMVQFATGAAQQIAIEP